MRLKLRQMSQSRLTCGGGGVAFAQPLRQLRHFAAYWFVAAQESIFGNGVVLRSAEGPVVILLRGRKETDGENSSMLSKPAVQETGGGLRGGRKDRSQAFSKFDQLRFGKEIKQDDGSYLDY